MARAKKKVALTAEEYNEFITGLEITQVYLLTSNTERFGFPDTDKKLIFDIPDTSGELVRFDNNSGFLARLPHTIDLLEVGSDNSTERFASISVTFEVHYRTKKPITDEIFEIFRVLNLGMNLWPYVREFVQSTTLKMGLPGLVLPAAKI